MGEHTVRGRAYRAPGPDPRFRHAAGRATVPARPTHLRAAHTDEMPAVRSDPELPLPFWLTCLVWFVAAAVAIAMLSSAWAVGQTLQLRHALEHPVTVTAAPTP